MQCISRTCFAALLLACCAVPAVAQKKNAKLPTENDYYKLLRYEVPKGEVLEAGAIEALPGGKVAVGTRRGEIWVIDNGLTADPKAAKFTRFAQRPARGARPGVQGRLALRHATARAVAHQGHRRRRQGRRVRDGQRRWEINGDYHEYAFGSRFDKHGNIWVTLCLTGSFNSSDKFRGWAGKITPRGQVHPDHQRRALARRRRLQCRGRHLLHRQPGPLERHLRPQADCRGRLHRPSGQLQMVSRRQQAQPKLGPAPQDAQER